MQKVVIEVLYQFSRLREAHENFGVRAVVNRDREKPTITKITTKTKQTSQMKVVGGKMERVLRPVSHRIPRKNKNAVYCLQISALVPEIFVFEK